MDSIFKNNTELKKEYQFLHRHILPFLNKCGNCNKFKCDYCLKFSVACKRCIRDKCQNCYEFNRSKNILINSRDVQISNYVTDFLTDHFNVSDLSNQHFKMDISEEVREKDAIYIYSGKVNKIFCYNEEKINYKISYCFKGKKRQYHFKK